MSFTRAAKIIKQIAAGLGVLLLPVAAIAAPPAGYPAEYQKIIDAAKKEGKVVIYATTDTKAAEPIVKDFEALYPGIKVEYNDLNSTELYNRFISEAAAGSGTGDALWSSAMDLQVKLVSDGYAVSYHSPEAGKLPAWAAWKDQAYGTTYEPISFVYNKRLLQGAEIPKSHADLSKILSNPKFKGKVVSYDPERSGVGFSYLTQDLKNNGAGFWDMAKALGGAGVKVYTSTGAMMEKISSGEALLGYNIIGSYAFMKAKKDPSIGYVYPSDYTVVMSRVIFIPKKATHPNAAKLWLDYVLSARGQQVISDKADLFSIRSDIKGETTMAGLSKQLGAGAKPIPISAETIEFLDQKKRLDFLKKWQQTLGTVK
ncbi:MAG TPA: ABC transporter substrate-binding protein [Desulfuromonadales bacterium]|nr:ABC transporter substrate-binding protein [Desulfuromonadales bacterium]